MTSLEWGIIAIYMGSMIALSVFLGRGQKNKDDYYVGGRNPTLVGSWDFHHGDSVGSHQLHLHPRDQTDFLYQP